MPKLGKQAATQAADKADDWSGGDLQPLDEGLYVLRLRACDDTDARKGGQPLAGPAGPYWKWEWEEVETNSRLWSNTSLSPGAIGQIGKIFASMGFPPDTDTADLIGYCVGADVVQRVIQGGKRAGSMGNEIASFLPPGEVNEDWEAFNRPGQTAASSNGREAEAAASGSKRSRGVAKPKEGETWDEEPF